MSRKKLAEKVIGVRLPQRVLDRIQEESERDGIDVTNLVRRAIMHAYSTPGEARESSHNASHNVKPPTSSASSSGAPA